MNKNVYLEKLQAQNPFAVKNGKGMLIWFKDAKEAYQLFLTDLFSQFPAGYIDLPLYMTERQCRSPEYIMNTVQQRQYAFVEWWKLNDDKVRNNVFQIADLLLNPGIEIDFDLLNNAMDNLLSIIHKSGADVNLQNINNLHVIYDYDDSVITALDYDKSSTRNEE